MAAPASPPLASVVPAQLGFLAIFNPSLGITDDTLDDQIVYYASVNTQGRKHRHRSRGKPTEHVSQEERNERLRQIGLAQGMVEFGRGFSAGQSVDTIETEQSRVILHEVEPGWWILAVSCRPVFVTSVDLHSQARMYLISHANKVDAVKSIDLTKIPLPPRLGATPNKSDAPSDTVEFSTREMKPSILLMQDLLRAHSIFLLHHSTSLSALFVRLKRNKFVGVLSRYWDLFLSTWSVMLQGSPATNIFGGIRIAASGELGVGVGEEDRGSGEREVLEGFVGRVEGLVDLIVCKFGPSDLESGANATEDTDTAEPWLGTGDEPGSEDGAIFLGVGALSRKSVRDITYWMDDLYTWGEDAYGVKDRPTSVRQARKARRNTVDAKAAKLVPSIEPGAKAVQTQANPAQAASRPQPSNENPGATSSQPDMNDEEGGINKIMSYLKMGYGTHWTLGAATASTENPSEPVTPRDDVDPKTATTRPGPKRLPRTLSNDMGQYLIGLMGDVEEAGNSEGDSKDGSGLDSEDAEYNSRVLVRTLTVEVTGSDVPESEVTQDLGSQDNELSVTKSGRKDMMDPNSHFDSQDRNKTQKVRVVVYVNKPFVYTFLFHNRTDSLAWDGLYRSLHYQLSPLRKPLALSTAFRPERPGLGKASPHIFDLVWDPKALTIHSTIPSIPETLRQGDSQPVWSRGEAVNTHNQILNTYISTLTDYSEVERTCKTNRGWWVVWMRIPDKSEPDKPISSPDSRRDDVDNPDATSSPTDSVSTPLAPSGPDSSVQQTNRTPESSEETDQSQTSRVSNNARRSQFAPKPRVAKEIFLIRRAGEHGAFRGISSSYAEGGGWGDGASRLAQGIGVDTRQYIDNLLRLHA